MTIECDFKINHTQTHTTVSKQYAGQEYEEEILYSLWSNQIMRCMMKK